MSSKANHRDDLVASNTHASTKERPPSRRSPYVLSMFAFEVRKDPWRMRLVDFLPSPTSKSIEPFINKALANQRSVVMKCTNSEGRDLWSCSSDFDSKQVLLLAKFSEELYQQSLRDGGLTVPSQVRGETL